MPKGKKFGNEYHRAFPSSGVFSMSKVYILSGARKGSAASSLQPQKADYPRRQ